MSSSADDAIGHERAHRAHLSKCLDNARLELRVGLVLAPLKYLPPTSIHADADRTARRFAHRCIDLRNVSLYCSSPVDDRAVFVL